MHLSLDEFYDKAHEISMLSAGDIGFDFETDGLSVYKGSRAFLMGFTDNIGNKYSVYTSPYPKFLGAMTLFFRNPNLVYCAHNAKFELSFLRHQFKIDPPLKVWDTEVNARLEKNNYLTYSLQACAERVGQSKHKPMLDWLKERGNKGQYFRAPPEIILPYVEQDAWLSWWLKQLQTKTFKHWDIGVPPIKYAVKLERDVLPHLFQMESDGMRVDLDYCQQALTYEQTEIKNAEADFKRIAGVDLVDSRKTLQPLFDAHGVRYGRTELGNASFTERALTLDRDHPLVPLVAAVLRHRGAVKRSSAYWSNFLELADSQNLIHPNINQNRAQTGRMSISEPSCQNWSTDEDEKNPHPYPIRRAFIADPGCKIVSLDYAQMELRLAADEADDLPMIERIKSGADLHQEVAEMAGVPRSQAKNGRFAKQYGASNKKIAETLGVEIHVAEKISRAIDEQAKAITAYSYQLSRQGRAGPVFDWLGRRFYFDRGFEYKAFNYVIQGGCAEILKLAIIEVAGLIHLARKNPLTRILIPIHDEILLNMHEDDLYLIPMIKQRMIEAHKSKKILEMDVSVNIGPNFYDLEPWHGPAS